MMAMTTAIFCSGSPGGANHTRAVPFNEVSLDHGCRLALDQAGSDPCRRSSAISDLWTSRV